MKSLKTLNTLTKIGKIFSKVVFILSIVGGAFCIAGSVITFLCHLIGLSDFDMLEETGLSMLSSSVMCFGGIVSCAGEAVLAKFAEIYFTNEEKRGTPFTYEGSKECLRLGILAIAIPFGTNIVSSVITAIGIALTNNDDGNVEVSTSIELGLMFILASVVFKYGADVIAEKNNAEVKADEALEAETFENKEE